MRWKTIAICGIAIIVMVATVNCRSGRYVYGKSLRFHKESYHDYKHHKESKEEKKKGHNSKCKKSRRR